MWAKPSECSRRGKGSVLGEVGDRKDRASPYVRPCYFPELTPQGQGASACGKLSQSSRVSNGLAAAETREAIIGQEDRLALAQKSLATFLHDLSWRLPSRRFPDARWTSIASHIVPREVVASALQDSVGTEEASTLAISR